MPLSASDTAIVIAAYNEATIVRSVVDEIVSLGYQVFVVDDGSQDETFDVMKGSAAVVCRHAVNLGQGAALQTGIQLALKSVARYIVTFDADGQHDPKEIDKILKPLRDNEVQVTLGSRFMSDGAAIGIAPMKRLLLRAAILFTKITLGLRVTDTHNGFRAFKREAASRLHLTQNRMAHATQILAQIRKANLSYCEVPVRVRYTPYSRRKGQKSSNFINILWEILEGVFGL